MDKNVALKTMIETHEEKTPTTNSESRVKIFESSREWTAPYDRRHRQSASLKFWETLQNLGCFNLILASCILFNVLFAEFCVLLGEHCRLNELHLGSLETPADNIRLYAISRSILHLLNLICMRGTGYLAVYSQLATVQYS